MFREANVQTTASLYRAGNRRSVSTLALQRRQPALQPFLVPKQPSTSHLPVVAVVEGDALECIVHGVTVQPALPHFRKMPERAIT